MVGATGAGKTSLINLINRLMSPRPAPCSWMASTPGTCPWRICAAGFAWCCRRCSSFPAPWSTNIRLGAIRREHPHGPVLRAAQEVHAHDFIVKLVQRIPDGTVRARQQPLGGAKTAAVVRARPLCFDPEILILDEATSSVDTETEGYIRDAIQVLMKGRTSIIIAHRLSTIQMRIGSRCCTRARSGRWARM